MHSSTVGKQALLSLADAQRAQLQKEYPALHGDCLHHAWVRIDDGVDFSDTSFDVGGLPVLFLGYKAGGNQQRMFHEEKLPASWQAKLGSKADEFDQGSGVAGKLAQLPANAAVAVKEHLPQLQHAAESGAELAGKAAVLQVWSVAALVVMAFACGVLLQRHGGRLLHAGTVALRKQQGHALVV